MQKGFAEQFNTKFAQAESLEDAKLGCSPTGYDLGEDKYSDSEYTDELPTCHNSLGDPDETARENEQRDRLYGGGITFSDHWTLEEL